MQQACLFCRVIGRETPADFVHEDDLVVAFRDLRPQAPVHLLIAPKKHIATLNDLVEYLRLTGRMARELQRIDLYRSQYGVA